MLKKHRNELLGLIGNAGVDPFLFTTTTDAVDGYPTFRLTVNDSDSKLYFTFTSARLQDGWVFRYIYSRFAAAHPTPTFNGPWGTSTFGDFENAKYAFQDWLQDHVEKYFAYRSELLEDRATPDLWADLSRATSGGSELLTNTPFTPEEQARIEDSLREFEQTVENRQLLSEEQARLLHDEIEHLIQASKHFGRKDWLNMAGGALMGFTVQAGLTSHVTIEVLRLAGQAIRWIAQSPLLLPG